MLIGYSKMDTDLSQLFGQSPSRIFDDPFLLPSSKHMPENLETTLDFCLFIYILNPQYAQASARVARHFITDFDYPGKGSQEEQNQFDEFLHYQLMLPLFMAELGDETACYGNAFARIHFPFDRFLIDPRSATLYALDYFGSKSKYHWKEMVYEVPDPKNPKSKIKMKFQDRKSMDVSRIRLRKLPPKQIRIKHHPFSGTSEYVYMFDPEIIADVKKGRLHVVNDMPIKMLQAVAKNHDFAFDPDTIFHFKAPTISGISNQGWGIPGTLANFRNIYQLQVYRKLDEAVGLDYMVPFRLFSPAESTGPNDLINNVLMAGWSDNIAAIIDNRRRDKFAIHSLPFPVNYQEFGAQGKELTPHELMEYQTSVMLDGMGYPQELFSGSLQFVQIPTALRLFENSFMYIHVGFNQLTQWVSRRVRNYLNQPRMEIRLQRPSIADSLERKQLIFQLASMGEISRETGYDSLGIDNVQDEFKKRFKEDAARQVEQARMDAELKKQIETGQIMAEPEQGAGSQPGSPAGGPVPAGGGGNTTPLDVQGQAASLAQYWMSLPDGQRRTAMEAVRTTNPALHALAKEQMEVARRAGESQGRQMVNEQAQQPGGLQQ